MPNQVPLYPEWPSNDVKPTISHSSEGDYFDCARKWLYEKEARIFPWAMQAQLRHDKALQPTQMLVGSVADAIIEDAFRHYNATGQRPDEYIIDPVLVCKEHFQRRAKFTIAWKKAHTQGQDVPNPEKFDPLEGIIREPKISTDEARTMVEKAARAITNLFASPLYARLMALNHQDIRTQPRGFVNRQKLAIPWYYAASDLVVYASYDLLVQAPDNKWIIIDWKTGRRDSGDERAETQLNYYAGFVMKEYGAAAEDIELVAAWIGEGTSVTTYEAVPGFVERSEPRWREWRDRVRDDVQAVRRDWSQLDARFPMVSDIHKCRYCKYHSCPGYQRHKAVGQPATYSGVPQA